LYALKQTLSSINILSQNLNNFYILIILIL